MYDIGYIRFPNTIVSGLNARELRLIKSVVTTLGGDKLLMATLLCYSSAVDNDYLICVTDSGKSVSDDKGRSVFHKSHHCGLNVHLSSGINRGSGLSRISIFGSASTALAMERS